MKYLLVALLTACFFSLNVASIKAQGDGPRAYWPVPKNTNIVVPLYTYINSNQIYDNPIYVLNANFNTNIYGVMYTRSFNFFGKTGGAVAMLTAGGMQGGIPNVKTGSTSGLGDLYIISVINLIGAPAVDLPTYATSKYNFTFNALFAFRAPTGKYNQDDLLNIGTNRWEIKAGAPMIKFFNWGTKKTTSIEVLPTISFFTNNKNPQGSISLITQKPLFMVENHITQSIGRMLWASFDIMYRLGGETTTDNIVDDNKFNTVQLGATLGTNFSRSINLKVTYGAAVGKTKNRMEGYMIRAMLSFIF